LNAEETVGAARLLLCSRAGRGCCSVSRLGRSWQGRWAGQRAAPGARMSVGLGASVLRAVGVGARRSWRWCLARLGASESCRGEKRGEREEGGRERVWRWPQGARKRASSEEDIRWRVRPVVQRQKKSSQSVRTIVGAGLGHAIRLGWICAGLEPVKGNYDYTYFPN
jgi:hypothetical protein